MHRHSRSGHPGRGDAFTLLELLVVFGIIAILAAILMPVLGGMKQRSYASKSSSNLRQIVMANIAYAGENGRYVPAANRANNKRWCGARSGTGSRFDPTKGYLSEYLGKTGAVIADPLFTEMLKNSRSFEEGSGGYGYNAWYIGGTPSQTYNSDGTLRTATLGQVSRPSTTVMFATTAYARDGGVQEYPFAEPPFWDFGNGPTERRPSPSVHFRFEGKAIVGWCDGHISFEVREDREEGDNPPGGNAKKENLGWFGPDKDNGYWNPNR